MRRPIEASRHHGDIVVAQSPKIGVGRDVVALEITIQVEVLFSFLVNEVFEILHPTAGGLTTDLDAFQRLFAALGEVHIEADALGQTFLQHLFRDFQNGRVEMVEVGIGVEAIETVTDSYKPR